MARDEIAKAKFVVIPWVGSHTPVRVFLDTAGRAAYGKVWPSDAAKIVGKRGFPTKHFHNVRLIADEIISAGIAGKIPARLQAELEVSRDLDGLTVVSVEKVNFRIKPNFWMTCDAPGSLDWFLSTASVSKNDLELAGGALRSMKSCKSQGFTRLSCLSMSFATS